MVRLLVGAFTILVICGLVSVLVAEVGSLIIGLLMRGRYCGKVISRSIHYSSDMWAG